MLILFLVDSNPSVTWDFQLPEVDNLIPESSSFQFSVVADLFGPALEVGYTLLFSLDFYLVENVSLCILAYKELEMDYYSIFTIAQLVYL